MGCDGTDGETDHAARTSRSAIIRTPLVLPGGGSFPRTGPRAFILGTYCLPPCTRHGRKIQVWLPANLIRFTQTTQKSRFNGIMPARSTNPAHLLVVEQEAEESDHVTRLDIYLGTLPLNGIQQERAAVIFYDFSSREFPHSSGFAISTGINSLSCQVHGMILNHSGPPAKKSRPGGAEDVPVSSIR